MAAVCRRQRGGVCSALVPHPSTSGRRWTCQDVEGGRAAKVGQFTRSGGRQRLPSPHRRRRLQLAKQTKSLGDSEDGRADGDQQATTRPTSS